MDYFNEDKTYILQGKLKMCNERFEVFRKYYIELDNLRTAINREVISQIRAVLPHPEVKNTMPEDLLKLRDVINEATRYCEEAMYESMTLMGQELIHMKEDFKA